MLLSLLAFVALLETCVIHDACDTQFVKQFRRVSSLGVSMTDLVILMTDSSGSAVMTLPRRGRLSSDDVLDKTPTFVLR